MAHLPSWLEYKMQESHIRYWQYARKRGPVFFVLVGGVLLCGSLAFAVQLCTDLWLSHKALQRSDVLEMVFAKALLGLFAGLVFWFSNERSYRKALQKRQTMDGE